MADSAMVWNKRKKQNETNNPPEFDFLWPKNTFWSQIQLSRSVNLAAGKLDNIYKSSNT